MQKIASPQELTVELRKLLAYAEGREPSRNLIAGKFRDLAVRLTSRSAAGPELDVQKLHQMLDQARGMGGMEVVEAELRRLLEKAETPAVAPSARHPLKVGDILECSWGYDQTNLDYYLVTKILGVAMVEIREVAKKYVGEREQTNIVMPDVHQVIGAPMRKKVQPNGAVRITSFSSAYPWDKKPGWETKAEYGH